MTSEFKVGDYVTHTLVLETFIIIESLRNKKYVIRNIKNNRNYFNVPKDLLILKIIKPETKRLYI